MDKEPPAGIVSGDVKTVIHYKDGAFLPVTENWIYAQIMGLRRYKSIVYCHGIENSKMFPLRGIRSFGHKTEMKNKMSLLKRFWNEGIRFHIFSLFYLSNDRPVLVHAHFGHSGYAFLTFKNIFRVPLITTFYGHEVNKFPAQYPKWRKNYIKLFREGEHFLVEGPYMKKCLIELGCPEEKIAIQHIGVDLSAIKYVPRKMDEKKEARILISASFREKKGIPCAIEAFWKVKNNIQGFKMALTIIGDAGDNAAEKEEKRKILGSIEKYGLKNDVRMLGYQEHPVFIKELYDHQIFLSPSLTASDGDTEGGVPVSIIEATASGMPVLSTLHCDIPEVVMNNESGYLVPERDVNTLAEKLEFLIKNPSSWEKMGLAGRKHIEEDYDIEKQVKGLEEIYGNILSTRKSKRHDYGTV